MAKYFNKNLKYVRQQKGISQQELADKLNIDRSTVSRWENEDMEATLTNAMQVADALKVPLPEFLGTDLSKDDSMKQFDELELLFDKHKDILTPADKAVIKTIIEERKKEIDKELEE